MTTGSAIEGFQQSECRTFKVAEIHLYILYKQQLTDSIKEAFDFNQHIGKKKFYNIGRFQVSYGRHDSLCGRCPNWTMLAKV